MIIVIVIVVAVAILAVIAAGNVIAIRQSPPSVIPGNNDSGSDCNNLCLQFNNRRSERCMAQADVRNAQTRLNFLIAQRETALRAWAVATAAAIAAMFIPIFGPLISSGFATAAAIAFTAFLGFAGAVNGASADLLQKTAIASICMNKEAEARQLLLTKCPEQANACLATPSPC